MTWKKGQSGNPKGTPKKPEVEQLRQAIATVEKKQKKKLWQHMVERAYKNDALLTAIAKKFVPDLSSIEASVDVGDKTLTLIQKQQQLLIDGIKKNIKESKNDKRKDT